MGNVADKGRCQGYYGATGEHISYENADDFLVVTLSPACTGNPPEEARAIKSPFEVPAVTLTTGTTDVRRTGLEGSVDSGYAEVHAAAGKTTSRETHPEPIPSKPLENVSIVVMVGHLFQNWRMVFICSNRIFIHSSCTFVHSSQTFIHLSCTFVHSSHTFIHFVRVAHSTVAEKGHPPPPSAIMNCTR